MLDIKRKTPLIALVGAMALMASGLHMAAHVAALLVAAAAYALARRHAGNPVFSFGTGKVGYLAGFANAVVLGVTSVLIAAESIHRLLTPGEVMQLPAHEAVVLVAGAPGLIFALAGPDFDTFVASASAASSWPRPRARPCPATPRRGATNG